jgi:hypothetical protein
MLYRFVAKDVCELIRWTRKGKNISRNITFIYGIVPKHRVIQKKTRNSKRINKRKKECSRVVQG